jgi:hypothetical protein
VPLILLAIAIILVPAVIALCVPLSIVQRYRTGTARRPARVWVAGLNAGAMLVSATTFLITAAVTTVWIPGAWSYSLAGLGAGLLIGTIGVAVSHWEPTDRQLTYTPNRWLVLSVTILVAVRIAYGLWRAWHAWQMTPEDRSWLREAGIPGSMAIGALLLGYYLSFWTGIWIRAQRHRRTRVTP